MLQGREYQQMDINHVTLTVNTAFLEIPHRGDDEFRPVKECPSGNIEPQPVWDSYEAGRQIDDNGV
jgi:hypothetical protein